MIDEFLVHIFGEAVFGRIGHSKRAQLLARLGFGLLGALQRRTRPPVALAGRAVRREPGCALRCAATAL